MMGGHKQGLAVVFCLLTALLLSGCMFKASFEELYQVPQLPDEYTQLQEKIEEILSDGAEYVTPVSGTNIQSVQLVDLNGDGIEEALAFFRNNNEERPLKIYIFRALEDSYEQAALIEGNGTSIQSIYYIDMDNDGVRELIIGWRVNAEVKAVSVYSIRGFAPKLLMDSLYTQYETLDFDEDGIREMVLLRSDMNGNPIAEYFEWEGQSLRPNSFARLSMTMAELERVDIGRLRDGKTALFITGVAEDTRAITDILTYANNGITNIVRSDVTGVSGEVFRHIGLQPADIDGDGVMEVPMPVQLPSSTPMEKDPYWQVYWRNYNMKGQGEVAATTYHNIADGWYLMLPEQWDGVLAVRSVAASDERGVVFSTLSENGHSYLDVLGIYTITGNSREYKASRNGRFVLKRQVDTIYAASFLEGSSRWKDIIGQEELNQRFRLIMREWDDGEN